MNTLKVIPRILTALLLVTPALSLAELDQSSQEALKKTMELLRSKTEREKYMKNNKAAGSAGQQVDALATSPEVQKKIYELTAQIMKTMTNKNKGDGKAMMQQTVSGKSNPAAFAEQFTPEQKKMLKEIAEQIERETPSKP